MNVLKNIVVLSMVSTGAFAATSYMDATARTTSVAGGGASSAAADPETVWKTRAADWAEVTNIFGEAAKGGNNFGQRETCVKVAGIMKKYFGEEVRPDALANLDSNKCELLWSGVNWLSEAAKAGKDKNPDAQAKYDTDLIRCKGLYNRIMQTIAPATGAGVAMAAPAGGLSEEDIALFDVMIALAIAVD